MTMPKMSEADLQDSIIELAKWKRWLVYHTYDSRRSPSGFLDLVLLKPNRLVIAELKSDTGRVSTDQRKWLDTWGDLMNRVNELEVYVWRPADLRSGAITAVINA